MRVALVYDRVNKFGGAERILLALHEIWPDAPLYTAVYDPGKASWAHVFSVHSSFLQTIPFARRFHEYLPWVTPLAFESFTFEEYNLVISITSAEAKNVITKPATAHICYCLTPTRYLWSGYDDYHAYPGFGIFDPVAAYAHKTMTPYLRRWDLVGSSRPDCYVAISETVKQRIENYYHRHVDAVIYPPVDLGIFSARGMIKTGDFFLTVARLVGYKHVDIIVEAFNRLGWPLVVIGDGRDGMRLKKKAMKNIKFIEGNLTDQELVNYYKACRAFIFAGIEDFGLVAVEAQACGKPVICYRNSGMAEAIIDGKTGIFFEHQTPGAVIGALRIIETMRFSADACVQNARRFGAERFRHEFFNFTMQWYERFKEGKDNS